MDCFWFLGTFWTYRLFYQQNCLALPENGPFTSDSQCLLWKYLKIIRIQPNSRVTFYWWGRYNKGNEWYLAEAITNQKCFAKRSSVILGKLTEKHLWWSLFSAFRCAILVKKILINNPFSVNGYKHLWTAASESNLRMSTILIVLLYLRYKGRVKRFKGVP